MILFKKKEKKVLESLVDDRVTEWWEPLAPWSLVEGCPVTMFMVWQTTVACKAAERWGW